MAWKWANTKIGTSVQKHFFQWRRVTSTADNINLVVTQEGLSYQNVN